jgi:hypothetical protein
VGATAHAIRIKQGPDTTMTTSYCSSRTRSERGVSAVSARTCNLADMDEDPRFATAARTDEGDTDGRIRRAIGGDVNAVSYLVAAAPSSGNARFVVLAGLLESRPDWIDRAAQLATTRCDRQTVAIARSHAAGDRELVDALARDHLVDFPDSLIVAWIASGAGTCR